MYTNLKFLDWKVPKNTQFLNVKLYYLNFLSWLTDKLFQLEVQQQQIDENATDLKLHCDKELGIGQY